MMTGSWWSRALASCIAMAGYLGVTGAAHAAVCLVTSTADVSVPGTLRWCVSKVNSGAVNEIQIPAGWYGLETPLQFNRSAQVHGTAGVLILPGETFSADTLIRVGCGGIGGCAPAVSFDKLEVGSGFLPGLRGIDVRTGSLLTLTLVVMDALDNTFDGGALRAQQGTIVSLVASQFLDNHGGSGGAVHSAGDRLEVSGCSFEGNSASGDGGALLFMHAGPFTPRRLQVDDTEFLENQAVDGGAVFISGPIVVTAELNRSTFDRNAATRRGGAIDGFADVNGSRFDSNTAPTGGALSLGAASRIVDSLFLYNRGFHGGGIAFVTSSATTGLTLQRSTLAKNDFNLIDDARGAGVFLSGGAHLIENTTLSGNGSPATVVGVFTGGGGLAAVASAKVELRHATLEGNAADLGGGVFVDGANLIASSSIVADSSFGDDCDITGGLAETTSLDSDMSCGFTFGGVHPLLGGLAANGGPTPTHLPSPASPALGRAVCFATLDQRGLARPAIKCDVGSVER